MIIPNRHCGESLLIVENREYLLRFTFDALARLQAALGLTSLDGLLTAASQFSDLNSGALQKFIYWSLRNRHPEVTEQEVGAWDLLPYFGTVRAVGEALQLALGGETESPLAPENPPITDGIGAARGVLRSQPGSPTKYSGL